MHRKVESELLSFKHSDFSELEKKRNEGWYVTHLRSTDWGCIIVLERVTPRSNGFYLPPRRKLKIDRSS